MLRFHFAELALSARPSHSNWSSSLVLSDWLHGTLCREVPQRAIAIGVPAYRAAHELTLPRLLAMPFGAERPAWRTVQPRARIDSGGQHG